MSDTTTFSTPGDNPVSNVPAPAFDPDSTLTMEEKVDYMFAVVKKIESLFDSVTPEQMERVQSIASNPLMRKLFGG